MESENSKLNRIIRIIYAIASTAVLAICILFSNRSYAGKTNVSGNLVLLVYGIGLLLAIVLFGKNNRPKSGKYRTCVLLICFVISLIQIYAVSKYYFHPGWDAGLVETLVNSRLDGQFSFSELDGYYSLYPNNLFISSLYYAFEKALISAGLWRGYAFFSLLALNVLVCQVCAILMFEVSVKLSGRLLCSVFSFTAYELLVGFSPWLSVPYSDSFGLLFPVLILFIYLINTDNGLLNTLKWLVIGMLVYLSYSIKPQASITGIAVILYELFSKLKAGHKKKTALKMAAAAAGVFCAVLLVNASVSTLEMNINREEAVGPAHYLMMGLNYETDGMFSEKDVEFTTSLSPDERTRADLVEASKRLNELEFSGVCKHIGKKILSDYNDGTFAWWGEGNFVSAYTDEDGTKLCYFFRNLYYKDGLFNRQWQAITQIIWLSLLLIMPLAAFCKKDRSAVLLLAYLGILLFNILFETRARYLFANVPVLIIISGLGFNALLKVKNKNCD